MKPTSQRRGAPETAAACDQDQREPAAEPRVHGPVGPGDRQQPPEHAAPRDADAACLAQGQDRPRRHGRVHDAVLEPGHAPDGELRVDGEQEGGEQVQPVVSPPHDRPPPGRGEGQAQQAQGRATQLGGHPGADPHTVEHRQQQGPCRVREALDRRAPGEGDQSLAARGVPRIGEGDGGVLDVPAADPEDVEQEQGGAQGQPVPVAAMGGVGPGPARHERRHGSPGGGTGSWVGWMRPGGRDRSLRRASRRALLSSRRRSFSASSAAWVAGSRPSR